jgi:CMP-N-acetylneuraminic acid synthetase
MNVQKKIRLIKSKFEGCPLLGTCEDPYTDKIRKVYYVGEEFLVGIVDDFEIVCLAPSSWYLTDKKLKKAFEEFHTVGDNKKVFAKRP